MAGAKTAFHRWASTVKRWRPDTPGAQHLSHIEYLTAFEAKATLRSLPEHKAALLEVVLHNSGAQDVVRAFIRYAQSHGAEPLTARRRDVRGLTFIPVRVDSKRAEEIARFSFVRVARGMPSLRPFRPSILRGAGFEVTLPTGNPIDTATRTVIFDGGIPQRARHALKSWVTLVDPLSGIWGWATVSYLQVSPRKQFLTLRWRFGSIHSGQATTFIFQAWLTASQGRYVEAIAACQEGIRRQPNNQFAHLILAATYIMVGREADARVEAAELLKINPKFSLQRFAKVRPHIDPENTARLVDALRKAGLPE